MAIANLDGPGRFNKVLSVVVVFFHPCCHCENIWVKDDVVGVEIYFGYQQVVRTSADFYLVL